MKKNFKTIFVLLIFCLAISNFTSVKAATPGDASVVINDIQTMDMGRYFIVGVDQAKQSNVYYRWQAYDFSTGSWTMFHDWTTETCLFWAPKHAGDYLLYVEAKVNDTIVASYSELQYFRGCVTSLGDIAFSCGSNGCNYSVSYTTNDSELMFRWLAYDVSTGGWSTVQNWSKNSSGQWRPTHAGDYFLQVEAKGGDGVVTSKMIVCNAKAPAISGFTQSVNTGFTGEAITLKGSYTDCTTTVRKQKYLVYDGTYWSEISQKNGEGVWKPNKEGDYLLCYEIYDGRGVRLGQEFKPFHVGKPELKINSIKMVEIDDLTYKLTADVQTNDQNIQYRWQYYDIAAGSWHSITGWSGSVENTWNAPKEGYYWLQLEAKLRDGTTQTKTEGVVAYRMQQDKLDMQRVAMGYSSSTRYMILVNRTTHKVGVFSGSAGNWHMDYYWDCADGKTSTPTVSGSFTVGSKGPYFDSGDARCFYYTQFYNSYLFHSVLYDKYNPDRFVDGRVGMGLSHGCVRLQIENAKWIYDNIPQGTRVVVY